MSKQYPCIGSKRKPHNKRPRNGPKCILCQQPTSGKVEVQVSYMRGDDEVEPVCGECQKGPEPVLLEKIVAVWRALLPTQGDKA